MASEMLPIVDVASLLANKPFDDAKVQETSKQLLEALIEWGFLYITDHSVAVTLQEKLEKLSRNFFALPLNVKKEIKMEIAGSAWRGYFPPGNELTSGIPDAKEGIYFGKELDDQHPKVLSRIPLHGSNLWPEQLPEFKHTVLEYLAVMEALGHALMRGIAIGLGLHEHHFRNLFSTDPTLLFRIFNYPTSTQSKGWGVGEHTDYGFLTILKTDHHPGLQVLSPTGTWIQAPPINNAFIINIGDQLEIATCGLLKATPHRVEIQRQGDRLSWPFFFDPNWDALLEPVDLSQWRSNNKWPTRTPGKRWDGKDLKTMHNTKYGEYLMEKVSRCFPHLFESVIS